MPPESAHLAREGHAFQRARVLESPADLLSLVRLYRLGALSVRELAGVGTGSGKPGTAAAVRQRLGACPQGVERRVGNRLPTRPLPAGAAGKGQLRLWDGAAISGPGATGTEYRWHVAYEPGVPQRREVPVREVPTGERLTPCGVGPGPGVLGERNFATAPALGATRAPGAQVGVRLPPQSLPRWPRPGVPFALGAAVRAAGDPPRLSLALEVRDGQRGQTLPVWLQAPPLSAPHSTRARRRANRPAGRRGRTPRAQPRFLSAGGLVLTPLPPEELGAADLREW